MKRKLSLSFIFVITVFTLRAQSGGGERYDDIDLFHRWRKDELRDSVYRKAYMQYAADSAGQGRVKTLAPFINNKPLLEEYAAIAASDRNKVEKLLALAGGAAKKNDRVMEMEALSAAFTEAFWRTKDYDRAFYIGFRLEERLPQVNEAEYPFKRETYYKLGEAYYLMLDFHKSIALLENALSPTPVAFDDRANLDALKIIGICYANIGRMDLSDNYFREALLSGDVVLDRPLYNAYALSHLGCNAMLTGRYDKALAISDTAWPILRRESRDYGHLAGMCYCRGRSYLEKGDFRQASVWIDSLVHFARLDRYNHTKRIKQAHLLRADYYTALGNARQAKVYNDSLVSVYKKGEENHISGYIARASQRYNCEKIADGEAELKASRMRLTMISTVALLLLGAAFIILSLYRKKIAAYKALAQNADRWAHEGVAADGERTANGIMHNGEPTSEEDLRIMTLVEREMSLRSAYRDPRLTAESLAERIGIPSNSLSRAIGNVSGGNFNSYLNGWRIKEAVRILSSAGSEKMSSDDIGSRVGFGNRSSFYRVFRAFTGLSPAGFRKNNTPREEKP